jgi:hypothetical protein
VVEKGKGRRKSAWYLWRGRRANKDRWGASRAEARRMEEDGERQKEGRRMPAWCLQRPYGERLCDNRRSERHK